MFPVSWSATLSSCLQAAKIAFSYLRLGQPYIDDNICALSIYTPMINHDRLGNASFWSWHVYRASPHPFDCQMRPPHKCAKG